MVTREMVVKKILWFAEFAEAGKVVVDRRTVYAMIFRLDRALVQVKFKHILLLTAVRMHSCNALAASAHFAGSRLRTSPVLAQQPSIASNSGAHGFGGGTKRDLNKNTRDRRRRHTFLWPDLKFL